MRIQCNNSQALFFLAALFLRAVSGFQQNPLCLRTDVRTTSRLNLNTPPQYPYDEDEFGNTGEPPLPTQGIPKLKVPTPSFSMPEIDFKETLKKFGVLAATVLVFVAIQKAGLVASEIFTPELSAEQVRDFRL